MAEDNSQVIDDQNFDVDINGIYNDFIKVIDNIRSDYYTANISENIANKIYDLPLNGKPPPLPEIKKRLCFLGSLRKTPQESRCHAFFRFIGFPIVSKDKKMFNPGYDIIFSKEKTITDDYKINVAKNQIDNFRKLSIAREEYINDIRGIFNTSLSLYLNVDQSVSNSANLSIDASTLAISSGRYIRNFNSSLKFAYSSFQIDPFSMEIKDQQYSVDFRSVVGTEEIDLSQYQDVNGIKPIKLFDFGERTHIITPFIVDPIIEFTVNRANKLVAIPFVPDASYQSVDKTTKGKITQPLLEQIIRKRRLSANELSVAKGLNKQAIDYVDKLISKDSKLVKQKKDIFKVGQQAQLDKFYNIIVSMIDKLIKAQKDIKNAQQDYYWIPIPSSGGPEEGCSVRPVLLPNNIDPILVTEKDAELFDLKTKELFASANPTVDSTTTKSDVGNFETPALKAFDLDVVSSLGNVSKNNFDKLSQIRTEKLSKANEALREIEIIMGEFSGLGFCDIVAILAALYLMPIENLYGFLDDDALKRMNSIFNTNITKPDITTSLTSFTQVAQYFYNLMDKIYIEKSQNNA